MKEKRMNGRTRAGEGVYAVLRPKEKVMGQDIDLFGQVQDVSLSGLAITYVGDSNSVHPSYQLDIVVSEEGDSIFRIPFRVVWDVSAGTIETGSTILPMRQRGIQFGTLTLQQRSGLVALIHTLSKSEKMPFTGIQKKTGDVSVALVQKAGTSGVPETQVEPPVVYLKTGDDITTDSSRSTI